jgi:alkaline phosphatase D
MMGAAQERWLADGLRRSVADGVRWQVLGQQTVMGSLSMAPEIAALIDQSNEANRLRTQVALAAGQAGLPYGLDQWDGYPAARGRLLASALEADANLIVLAGDSHNAWAFDLDHLGTPAGVEFAGQSVSSPGLEARVRSDPAAFARTVAEHNPQLRWADTSRRGYLTVTLTPERATGEFALLETVRERSSALAGNPCAEHGSRCQPADDLTSLDFAPPACEGAAFTEWSEHGSHPARHDLGHLHAARCAVQHADRQGCADPGRPGRDSTSAPTPA